jgi:hypothetical protein
MPPWTLERSTDVVLNFTVADAAARQQEAAAITFRGKPLDSVSLRKGYFYGNLAVVRFGSHYITAVRKIQFYITPRTAVKDYPLDPDPSKPHPVVIDRVLLVHNILCAFPTAYSYFNNIQFDSR